jgi:serine/threonine protein kinase
LITYFDSVFLTEKTDIDEWGNYGTHYIGLTFDEYFESSIYSIDYLDVYDYFQSTAGYIYSDFVSLSESILQKGIYYQLKVIESIINLISKSSYNETNMKEVISKSCNFLQRLGVSIETIDGIVELNTEIVKFHGSYCDIIFVSEVCLKKRLNQKHFNNEQWKIRMKTEFDNMTKLSNSDFVLKVFDFNEVEHSYLMEACECDLGDYLEINDLQIEDSLLLKMINDILAGLQDVHSSGIVHRDLHLGNILRKDNHFILADFGLSKDMMKVVSFKSSNTPKNSHMFMDPIGHTDFCRLDKLSDIYSIGKIIDFITRGCSLNRKLSYLIDKCTDRDRRQRYQSILSIINDLSLIIDEENRGQRTETLELQIKQLECSPEVERYLLKIDRSLGLSKYIVENRFYNFGKLLVKLLNKSQAVILESLLDNYVDATGYGGFQNYEVFSTAMCDYIKLSKDARMRKIAFRILKGCAEYRIRAHEQMETILARFPELEEL